MELENNALFWQKLDTIILSGTIVVDCKKGTTHPTYTNLIYPVDFAHLEDIVDDRNSQTNRQIHIYQGTDISSRVIGIVVSADILEKDCFVTVLVGCTEEERHEILEFMNQMECQKCIYIKRGNGIPAWSSDN